MSDEREMPDGAVIEILEMVDTLKNRDGLNCIVPNEVRINGQSLLASASDPVIVHEMQTTSDAVVRVTLTLFARRVIIEQRERSVPRSLVKPNNGQGSDGGRAAHQHR